jgi:hypothetical protein
MTIQVLTGYFQNSKGSAQITTSLEFVNKIKSTNLLTIYEEYKKICTSKVIFFLPVKKTDEGEI